MTRVLTVEAEPREEYGKGRAGRLRRSGRIPAVVYGGGEPSIPVAIDPKQIVQILNSESGHNSIFSLEVRGKSTSRVMLRDWQFEPTRGSLLHVDLVRIARDTKLKVNVPVHAAGEPKGVKLQGGIFEFVLREVELECLPDDIPEHITVDVTELMIGQSLRVADLAVGDKVKVLTDPNRVVAHVIALKAVEEEKPAEEAVEAAPAEPEVIRKGKAETEEEGEEAGGEAKAEAKVKAEKKEKKEK